MRLGIPCSELFRMYRLSICFQCARFISFPTNKLYRHENPKPWYTAAEGLLQTHKCMVDVQRTNNNVAAMLSRAEVVNVNGQDETPGAEQQLEVQAEIDPLNHIPGWIAQAIVQMRGITVGDKTLTSCPTTVRTISTAGSKNSLAMFLLRKRLSYSYLRSFFP